ncbi:unnamed protein product [Ranitomeya imitator]|uniref:Apple domain-containing protein n=1 Tax=Ranitomeya imitator TaxID=111125 RepID=A0ABN9LXS7_9NEOB|nr:unnamed protein product [Ranitomeya imitator]
MISAHESWLEEVVMSVWARWKDGKNETIPSERTSACLAFSSFSLLHGNYLRGPRPGLMLVPVVCAALSAPVTMQELIACVDHIRFDLEPGCGAAAGGATSALPGMGQVPGQLFVNSTCRRACSQRGVCASFRHISGEKDRGQISTGFEDYVKKGDQGEFPPLKYELDQDA